MDRRPESFLIALCPAAGVGAGDTETAGNGDSRDAVAAAESGLGGC